MPMPRAGNRAPARFRAGPKGLDQDEGVWSPAFTALPFVLGRVEVAAHQGGTGLSGPRRAEGHIGANLSQGADPYVESVGQPGALQLKDARFHCRSIIPQAARGFGAHRINACSLPTG